MIPAHFGCQATVANWTVHYAHTNTPIFSSPPQDGKIPHNFHLVAFPDQKEGGFLFRFESTNNCWPFSLSE